MAMVGERRDVFQWFLYAFFLVISAVMLYPFWHTLVGSLMTYDEYLSKRFLLWVSQPSLENYRQIMTRGGILGPLRVTAIVTVVGTVASLAFTAVVAYGLSKQFPGSRLIMVVIVFTMFVNAGIIPTYIQYRQLGLLNRYLVYWLPSLANTFNLIIMRTYFRAFSHEIEESALIDGASYYTIFLRIVLPLSRPILATIGLFYAVQYWDTFFQSLFFITNPRMQTLQHYLYNFLVVHVGQDELRSDDSLGPRLSLQTLRLANVMVTVAPIIMVYPFLQKHFVKGVMIGSLKG